MDLQNKPKIELTVGKEIKKEQKGKPVDKQTIFDRLKNDSDNRGIILRKRYNLTRRKITKYLLFPFILEKANIYNWKRLEEENELIEQKKSNHPKVVRDAIQHLHSYIEQYYELQFSE